MRLVAVFVLTLKWLAVMPERVPQVPDPVWTLLRQLEAWVRELREVWEWLLP